jgi:hypothetical protein
MGGTTSTTITNRVAIGGEFACDIAGYEAGAPELD